jgi:quercetin 2,3-dioxygenase
VSGPIQPIDTPVDPPEENDARTVTREGRSTEVGGLPVTRVLPTKGRRTVGAWCFVDLMGPADAESPDPMEVGPHPHIGLSTVTWLLEGEALHSDSLGTEQVIRPGQLNWMTAGNGIAHAELAARPPFRGAQMWVAQPEATRHGPSRFEHHAELPAIETGVARGVVFAGALQGVESLAVADTPLVGADLTLGRGAAEMTVEAGWEHAVVPLDGRVIVGGEVAEPGWLALVPPGQDTLIIEAEHPGARLLLLGGEPFERVAMWWNFVARDRTELEQAWRDWRDRTDRFGAVPSTLDRIEAPMPPWVSGEDEPGVT